MEYCSDFRYDLKVGNVKEEELAEIFSNKKIEVKYDRLALRTGIYLSSMRVEVRRAV